MVKTTCEQCLWHKRCYYCQLSRHGWCAKTLALFTGLPTIQFFDRLQYANGGGRLDPFYHVNDVTVYLGRQRGGAGGVPNCKNAKERA